MIVHGDCLTHLKTLEPDSLDSMVTDPPAGISFMGKGWDGDKGGREQWVAWMTEVMAECLRVLKPGAHALVWAIPRTSHWTMTALEDAGFEIRDVVTHLFGTGFPKSLDVSKALDKEAGAKREVVGSRKLTGKARVLKGGNFDGGYEGRELDTDYAITAPATDAARQWEGFGTAMKPACEFWILCRKPTSEKTVAKNVVKWGTGALNIDGCRIESNGRPARGNRVNGSGSKLGANSGMAMGETTTGRFPSNLVLSHNDDCDDECSEGCAVRALDEQSGICASKSGKPGRGVKRVDSVTAFDGKKPVGVEYGDSGGASRFFYCAKASKSDRNRKAK